MSTPAPETGLLAFYPLLYVAWADGELATDELELLRREAEGAGVDPELLSRWTNPEDPPEAAELLDVLAVVRRRASDLSSTDRESLASLGIALAEADGRPPSAAECEAIRRVEDAFGFNGAEAAACVLETTRPLAPLPNIKPAFDLGSMTRFLDGETAELKARLRTLLSDGRFEHVYGLSTPEYREQVLDWCRILADEGLGALSYPEEHGGGADPAAFVAVFETLGYFDLSLLIKFGVQFGLFGGSIHQLGSIEHHKRYLRDAGTLDLAGCFAMTETGHGSNVYDIETTAVYDADTREFEIDTPNARARKDYIGNAAKHGRLATVFAQLEVAGEAHGVHAILVPIRDEQGASMPGVRIEDCGEKLGLNGVDNGRLTFDHVRVPRENLLNRFAWINDDGVYRSPIASPSKRFFTMLGTLVAGRVAVGSAALTASKVALTIAVRYAERRRQFGPTNEPERALLDYPSHQRRLLPAVATTYALNFAIHDLQTQYVSTDEDRRRTEADAAGLKSYATWHATEVIQACREACGGQGFLAVNRFAALKADTEVFTTFEGDNTVLLQLVAKDLLTGFKQQFGDLGALGIARFLADRAATAVMDRNPIISRKIDEAHLRDPQFHEAMFEDRKKDLMITLARRVRARIQAGKSSFDALIECQNHALTAAMASVEYDIFKSMLEAEGRTPSSGVAEQMAPLRCLFALSTIERRRAWYLEEGYLDASKTKAIRRQVTALCAEIRPQAVPLVDAFAVPANSLEGTIAV